MPNLVDRWKRKAFANPIVAIVIVGFLVLSAVVGFCTDARTLFTSRGRLELVDVVAVNDRDSITVFRRTWLGDTVKLQPPRQAGDSLPGSARKDSAFRDAASKAVGPLVVRMAPIDTALINRWARSIPRGTGRFPIIDIKLRNTAASPAFLNKLEVVQTRRGPFMGSDFFCSFIGPSWEYNLLLDGSKASDRRTLDLSEAVDANGLDRFVVVVAQIGNAADDAYDLDLTLVYNGGRKLRLGTVTVRPGPMGCTGIHHIPDVRHIPSKP